MTYQQEKECEQMALNIIDNLDELALNELAGGYGYDFDLLITDVKKQCFDVLFGNPELKIPKNSNYTERFNVAVEHAMQVESLSYFILTVLKDFKMNWHHLEWCRLLDKYPRLCVLAARDHGKSYFFSNALALWRLFRYTKDASVKRKDIYLCHKGYLFSFSKAQVIELLRTLKETVEGNDILRDKLLPNNQKENWSKTEIMCKNGARLLTAGFLTSIRGAHPGWIIVDDPLKDSSMYSEVQRTKTIDHFHSVIMNMIVPGGQVVVVGTPFHKEDLYGDLKKKEGWRVFEYPAIFPDAQILWSDRYSAKDLMRKKADQGTTIFSRELLCRPVSNDSSLFPYDILRKATRGMEEHCLVTSIRNFPKTFDRVVMGCDFAISANVAADYSVFTVWGIDDNDVMWLLNMQRFKGKSYLDQIAILKGLNHAFMPQTIYAESNQFQMILVQMGENIGLPIFGHNTHHSNKNNFTTGLPGLSVLFEKELIKLPYGDEVSRNTADLLMNEFNSITYTDKGVQSVDKHDDMPMSTWLAFLAKNHLKASGTETRISFL